MYQFRFQSTFRVRNIWDVHIIWIPLGCVLILRQTNSDSPDWVEHKYVEYQKKYTDARDFTDDDLIDLFNDAMNHLRAREASPLIIRYQTRYHKSTTAKDSDDYCFL